MGYEKIEFSAVKAWLMTIKTEKEVLAERDKFFEEHKNLSDKQVDAFKRMFAERTDQIADEQSGVEHWDDKNYVKQYGW